MQGHLKYVQEEIQLPNEILAVIINELASDTEYNDRTLAALASCRLVSHVFRSLATPPFFSSIQLTDDGAPWTSDEDRVVAFKERATKLNQILTIHDIAASVHMLMLRFQNAILENSINCTLISTILRRLPHIRNFTLESMGEGLEFSSNREDFVLAIQAFCRSPSLTTLNLSNIAGFPIMFITECPNLQCLRLSCIQFCFDNMDPMDETSGLQLLHLESLDIDEDSMYSLGPGISGDISFAKCLSRIKNLRLQDLFCRAEILMVGWNIMLLASQSLTTLDLATSNKFCVSDILPKVLEVVPFEFGRFSALRHFKIELWVWFEDNVILLEFLKQLLSISFSTSGIEILEIAITWGGVVGGRGKDLFSSDTGWSALDEVLTFEQFVSLRKVVLCLGLEMVCYQPEHRSEFERNLTLPYVNALFPMFRALTNAQYELEIHLEII